MRHDPFPTRAEFKALQALVAAQGELIAELQRRASPAPAIYLTEAETNLPCAVLDERAGRAMLEALLAIAAKDTGIPARDIKLRTDRQASTVRQWVYFEAHQKGVALAMIGRFFGHKDHTSARHGCEVEARRRAERVVSFASRRAG